MENTPRTTETDLSSAIESEFVVSLRCTSGKYELFVEGFSWKEGKTFLLHTANIYRAARYPRLEAEKIAITVTKYRCTGQVERVSADGEREVVMQDVRADGIEAL